jgi:hypothetical protein
MGYSIMKIPNICSPVMIYGALNLSIKHAYPAIFAPAEQQNILENLLKERTIRYAKEPLIYYHEGYGPTNLYILYVSTSWDFFVD